MTNKLPVVGQRYRHQDAPNLIVKVSSVERGIVFFEKHEPLSLTQFYYRYEELPDSNSQKPEEVPEVASKDFMEGYNAGWNDFSFKKDYRFKEPADNEPKANETPNPVDFKKEEVNEVERALEELKSELKDWFESFPDFFLSKPECNHTWAGKRIGDTCEDCDDKFFSKVRPFCQNGVYYTLRKAQNLINALETEKEVTQEDWEKYHANHKYKSEYQEDIMSKPELKIDMKEELVEPVSIWKDVSELPEDLRWQELLIKRADLSIGLAEIGSYPQDIIGCLNSKEIIDYCTLTDFINSFEQMQKDIEELKRK